MKNSLVKLGGVLPKILENTTLSLSLSGWPATIAIGFVCAAGVLCFAIYEEAKQTESGQSEPQKAEADQSESKQAKTEQQCDGQIVTEQSEQGQQEGEQAEDEPTETVQGFLTLDTESAA